MNKELQAELLKERIYATLALLAVLISIDPDHYTPTTAGFLITGTIASLWAASLVATQMSKRVVFETEIDHDSEREMQLKKHAPMLAALVFPLLMLSIAYLEIISLTVAINLSIASAMLLLFSWSILSARSLKMTGISMVILIVYELLIGVGVVGLKIFIGH